MQLMTFNSLLMFDIVFMFFLFLVGVTCLVYYLPTGKPHRSLAQTTSATMPLTPRICRHRHPRSHFSHTQHQYHQAHDDDLRSEADCESELSSLMDFQKDDNDIKCQNDDDIDIEEGFTSQQNPGQHEHIKLCHPSHYPLTPYDKKVANARNHRQPKILYHCCPPCDLSDCEHYYINADELNSQRRQITSDPPLKPVPGYQHRHQLQKHHHKNNVIRSSGGIKNYNGRFLTERYRQIPTSRTSSQFSLESESSTSSLSLTDGDCLQEYCSSTGAVISVEDGSDHLEEDDDDNSEIIIYNGTNNRYNSSTQNFTDHFVVVKETERDLNCAYNDNFRSNLHRGLSENGALMSATSSVTIPSQLLPKQPYCCHVKAKMGDIKDCMGPIADV